MKTITQVKAEMNYVLGNKQKYFTPEGGLTALGKVELSKVVASLGDSVIKTEYGAQKLYEILNEMKEIHQDSAIDVYTSFKSVELALNGFLDKGTMSVMSELNQIRGKDSTDFVSNVIRVARAEGLSFPDCEYEYDAIPPEATIYERKIKALTLEAQRSPAKAEQLAEKIEMYNELLSQEQQRQTKPTNMEQE